jgi:hypothetical protein
MDDVMMQHLLRVARRIKDEKLPYSQQVFFNECGAAACLVGYACCDDAFRHAGLRIGGKRSLYPIFGTEGDEWQGLDAMINLLGLNWEQGIYIFGSAREIADLVQHHFGPAPIEDYASVDNMVKRVERVMAGRFAD